MSDNEDIFKELSDVVIKLANKDGVPLVALANFLKMIAQTLEDKAESLRTGVEPLDISKARLEVAFKGDREKISLVLADMLSTLHEMKYDLREIKPLLFSLVEIMPEDGDIRDIIAGLRGEAEPLKD